MPGTPEEAEAMSRPEPSAKQIRLLARLRDIQDKVDRLIPDLPQERERLRAACAGNDLRLIRDRLEGGVWSADEDA